MSANKASKKSSTKKPSATPSWKDKGQNLLEAYLKKTKSSGKLLVLSPYGDILFHSGKAGALDSTSIGSIFAAIQTATGGLNQLLGAKANTVKFGDEKSGFWLEPLGQQWLVVGVKVPHKPEHLTPFLKHLKSAAQSKGMSSNPRAGAPEALDGMSEASVEAALAKEME
jgi:hypothetical protein